MDVIASMDAHLQDLVNARSQYTFTICHLAEEVKKIDVAASQVINDKRLLLQSLDNIYRRYPMRIPIPTYQSNSEIRQRFDSEATENYHSQIDIIKEETNLRLKRSASLPNVNNL